MSKTTEPVGLACPVCQVALDHGGEIATCDRCGWAPRQGAD